jgi:hypothetical protein
VHRLWHLCKKRIHDRSFPNAAQRIHDKSFPNAAQRIHDKSFPIAGQMLSYLRANTSLQRIRPVSCMAADSVRIDPIVIARPVNPLKKKA